ncbi:hypothetical protein [Caballeronia sp. EK]|uniref:hypothetical protein n=1 Tax=Caballeronia sp. EK TaxID=2767469 RepID=UPI002815ECDE|nr:hypothetical protein [Caballeronia sp. EK]
MTAASNAHAGNWYVALFSDKVTIAFMLAIILLTLFFACIKFDNFAIAYGPEILTTVGISGCFLGIAMALLKFDPTNVSDSVPQLLDGVKTAFWASVCGVLGSLILRARHFFQKKPIPQSGDTPKLATIDDLVVAIHTLQRSLSGSEEGSLLTQLKLMRQEQADELRLLRTSFETFSQRMSEDGSKALIAALKEVIKDFNAQINDQFGEDFKHLNAAVEKLVVWQQQYKDELDDLQVQQKRAAEELGGVARSLGVFVDKASKFTSTADALESTLIRLSSQHKAIDESQRSLAEVLIQMKDVTPQFAQKIDEMSEAMKQSAAKVHSVVADILDNFGVQFEAASTEMKQLLSETLRKSQTELNDSLSRSTEAIRQSVVALDKALHEELSKSLQSLGRQLGSLSEKFVADYTPLTERLQELVRLGRGS